MRAIELAQKLGISRQRIYALMKKGRVKGAFRTEAGRWIINDNAFVEKSAYKGGGKRKKYYNFLLWKDGPPSFLADKVQPHEKVLMIESKDRIELPFVLEILAGLGYEYYRILEEKVRYKNTDWAVTIFG